MRSDDSSYDTLQLAAHELKSPLVLIRQLALELERMNTQVDTEVIEQIRLVSEKALRFSTAVTKHASLQTNLFPTESMHVKTVAHEVIGELAPLYRAYGRKLILKRQTSTPAITANRDLLRRILMNFADNALHYSDTKGVVELFMNLQRDQRIVRIGVRDYGDQLPAPVWRFMKGRTDSASVSNPQNGLSSGLGLMIACELAEAMGGKVGAVRHNDGASFYVDMPVSDQLALL